MENFQHQQSVWDLVKEYAPDSELPEIRTVLGEGLVDMYTEIYSEVQMWEQIYQKLQGCRSQTSRFSLADPPAVKELLRAELQLLLLTLREKAASLGRNEDDIMSRYSPRVVSYALGDSGKKERPDSRCETATPQSRPGSRSSHSGSRSSSRLSSRSSYEDEIEALRHKLNVTHIDQVVSHLKSFLTEECDALKRDIEFLQESVEVEYQKQREPESLEPSITELKEERRIIQRDLHSPSLMSEASDKPEPISSAAPSREKRLGGLPTSESEMEKQSTSLMPPRMDLLYLNPAPPDYCRPVHSGKARHRLSLKVLPQELTTDHCQTSISCWTSTTSTRDDDPLLQSSFTQPRDAAHTVRRASRPSPAADPEHKWPCGSKDRALVHSQQLGARALLPTPPQIQKTASRGQRASRRLALPEAAGKSARPLLSTELLS